MGWTFPWYSSYGSDFNDDFHATLDDRVAPVLLHFRTEAELAEAGTPWTGGPWTEDMRETEMPGISAFLRVGDEGRAQPLGLQVGGPAMRLPNEYDV
jgi:predicted dithiol-disulfide oxidoreductase (DUF899 family)